MAGPKIVTETDADGRRFEKYVGPRVERRLISKGDDQTPECKDQWLVTESYAAADVQAAGEEHPRAIGESGQIDGEVTGDFPWRNCLAEALAEAHMTPTELSAAAMLPVALVEKLLVDGEPATESQRAQLNVVLPGSFEQYGTALEQSPNQVAGDVKPSPPPRPHAPAGPSEAEHEQRSRRRDALVAEARTRRRAAVERQERADAARLAELRTGLASIFPKVRRLQERLGR